MVGKLFDSRDFLISIPADSFPSNLLFLKNSLSSNLVETGASVSVFPHHPGHPPAPSVGVQLRTVEGSAMDTFGSRQIHIQFCSHPFEWTFLLADVSMPILSSDFLHHLLVDNAGSCLLDASTQELISAVSSVDKPGKLLCNLFNGSQ